MHFTFIAIYSSWGERSTLNFNLSKSHDTTEEKHSVKGKSPASKLTNVKVQK